MTRGPALAWLAFALGAALPTVALEVHSDGDAISYAVAMAAVIGAVALAWRAASFVREPRTQAAHPEALQKLADEGRKLAIYDRVTGLYAYWYLQMRAEEEMSRAGRYRKPLAIVSLWCATKDAIERTTATLPGALRATDLAAYLGNGHFVLLLPETNAEGAGIVVERIRERVGADITGAAVQYPDDGDRLSTLLETAEAIDRVLSRMRERQSDAA